jgi:hypothetical protein
LLGDESITDLLQCEHGRERKEEKKGSMPPHFEPELIPPQEKNLPDLTKQVNNWESVYAKSAYPSHSAKEKRAQ